MESGMTKTLSASTLNESCINEFEAFIFNIPRAWLIHLLELFTSLTWFFLSVSKINYKGDNPCDILFERVRTPM
jgi:ABC-type antimicrobial peptide transport system permease subunit